MNTTLQEQLSFLSNKLDNALVQQKDTIYKLIRSRKYEDAFKILNFVKPMWEAFDYGYKYDELMEIYKKAQSK